MTDLREKVARAILPELSKQEMLLADPITLQRLMAKRCADAAIAAVLEALKAPSREMIAAGGNVHTYDIEQEKSVRFGEYAAASIYPVMIETFTRDHYLSALAEEDGREV